MILPYQVYSFRCEAARVETVVLRDDMDYVAGDRSRRFCTRFVEAICSGNAEEHADRRRGPGVGIYSNVGADGDGWQSNPVGELVSSNTSCGDFLAGLNELTNVAVESRARSIACGRVDRGPRRASSCPPTGRGVGGAGYAVVAVLRCGAEGPPGRVAVGTETEENLLRSRGRRIALLVHTKDVGPMKGRPPSGPRTQAAKVAKAEAAKQATEEKPTPYAECNRSISQPWHAPGLCGGMPYSTICHSRMAGSWETTRMQSGCQGRR